METAQAAKDCGRPPLCQFGIHFTCFFNYQFLSVKCIIGQIRLYTTYTMYTPYVSLELQSIRAIFVRSIPYSQVNSCWQQCNLYYLGMYDEMLHMSGNSKFCN